MNILSSPTTAYLRWSLEANTTNYQEMMEKLSSGYKINSCYEDVNAYKTAATMSNNISKNSVFQDNISYGNDALEIVSKAEENVVSQLSSIRDLCLQISNGTYSTDEKAAILSDIRSRLEYVDYVAASTSFNDKKLLDGSCTSYRIQIATEQFVDISDAMTDVHASALGVDIDPSVTAETWTTEDIADYITDLDSAMESLLKYETNAGAFSIGLDNSYDLKDKNTEALTAAKSNVIDIDYSKAVADLVKYQTLQQCSVKMETSYNQMASQTFQLLYPKG